MTQLRFAMALVSLCSLPLARAAAQEEPRKPGRLMSVAEILKAIEKSPVAYKIGPLTKAKGVDSSELAELLYPVQVKPVLMPQVRVVDGKREIVSAPCDLSRDAGSEAEALFNAHKYVEARAAYEAQIQRWPDCYKGYAYRGDTWFFAGDLEKALPDYNRALAMNPDEAALYTFRSNVYWRRGQFNAALEDLRRGLALRPRNRGVLEILRNAAGKMNVTVHDAAFYPRGFARKEGEAVGVCYDERHPGWLGYAACKGFWIGEPAHRKEMTGSAAHTFSMAEERECLAAMVAGYESQQGKPGFLEEPELARLADIVKSGFGNEWIVYELATRVDPQLVLRQSDETRARMLEYVRRFVVVDNPR